MKYFFASFNRFEIKLPANVVASCYHSGPCDADVKESIQMPYVAKQLAKIDPSALINELQEYGAWETYELVDHNANLERILWIACGNIQDQQS